MKRATELALAGVTLLAIVFAFAAYLQPANVWRWSVLLSLCQ